MINLATEIGNVLLANAAVATLTGSDPITAKIWNGWERVNAYPCVVIEIDDDSEQNDLSGTATMIISDVTLTCRGNSDTDSRDLWAAVRACLAGYSGTFEAILNDTQVSNTPKEEGSTAHWYDRLMNFTILWRTL